MLRKLTHISTVRVKLPRGGGCLAVLATGPPLPQGTPGNRCLSPPQAGVSHLLSTRTKAMQGGSQTCLVFMVLPSICCDSRALEENRMKHWGKEKRRRC